MKRLIPIVLLACLMLGGCSDVPKPYVRQYVELWHVTSNGDCLYEIDTHLWYDGRHVELATRKGVLDSDIEIEKERQINAVRVAWEAKKELMMNSLCREDTFERIPL